MGEARTHRPHDRDTTVGSYINAVLLEHLNLYADDIEIWRKL